MAKKYENHYQQQIINILEHTQRLCVEKGIDNVSIVDIANSCNITRATIYNYFDSKEAILWAIFHRNQNAMYEVCGKAISEAKTTYDKFKNYAYTFLELYESNQNYAVFMEIFGSSYMQATADDTYSWDNPHNTKQIKPGDMSKHISENFHDGSVKAELDPQVATVSFVYAISSLVHFILKSDKAIQNKYGIDYSIVIRTQIEWLLNELKA